MLIVTIELCARDTVSFRICFHSNHLVWCLDWKSGWLLDRQHLPEQAIMSLCLLHVEYRDAVASAAVTDNCHVVSFHLIELGLLLGLPTGLTARRTTPDCKLIDKRIGLIHALCLGSVVPRRFHMKSATNIFTNSRVFCWSQGWLIDVHLTWISWISFWHSLCLFNCSLTVYQILNTCFGCWDSY